MITIYKDKEVHTVSKGAFEQLFKPLGYRIKTDEKVVNKKVEKDNDKNNSSKETTINNNKSNQKIKQQEKAKVLDLE